MSKETFRRIPPAITAKGTLAINSEIRPYLEEACQFPQLLKEEERILGHTIRLGQLAFIRLKTLANSLPSQQNPIEEIIDKYSSHAMVKYSPFKKMDTSPLPEDTPQSLVETFLNAKVAFKKLVESNLLFVPRIAGIYQGKGISLADLIAYGNEGLLKAAAQFDPQRGGRFSTFAAYHIRQYVRRAIHNYGRLIRVPVYLQERAEQLLRLRLKLATENGTLDENLLQPPFYQIISLNKTVTRSISNGTPAELGDLITDPRTENLAEEIYQKAIRVRLAYAFNFLKPKEIKFLDLRFGINQPEEKSYEEIGKDYGITGKHVSQIVERALAKLIPTHKAGSSPGPSVTAM